MSAGNKTRVSHCTNCGRDCSAMDFSKWRCHCGHIQLACAFCTASAWGKRSCLALAMEHKRESHPIWRN